MTRRYDGILKHPIMTRTFRTEIMIAASPDEVWSHLNALGSYASWNPFIRKIEGDVMPDGRLAIRVKLAGLPEIGFKARIDHYAEKETLGWFAIFLKGFFEARHWFELFQTETGETLLVHSETFTGILVGPLLFMLSGAFLQGYEKMNRALKDRCEKKVTLL
ncbi:MAG: SRPBCC domain-containing protein [Chlorobiaceae bacterium]|nr:SRPBCC domain-containing protein [Chlorobiaceae bacterium]